MLLLLVAAVKRFGEEYFPRELESGQGRGTGVADLDEDACCESVCGNLGFCVVVLLSLSIRLMIYITSADKRLRADWYFRGGGSLGEGGGCGQLPLGYSLIA